MHPIAFQFGPITVTWYGILVACGFVAGLWTAVRRAPLSGIPSEKLVDVGPWLILGGLFGARLLYVLTFWEKQFAGRPFTDWVMIWQGGLVFYGGLVGATVGGLAFAAIKKLNVWKLADVLAPSVPLGAAFGRIGCLMHGCCFGRPSSLPWAIHFPKENESYPAAVHPAQVYDALLNLGLYLVLAWLYRRKRFDGQVFAAYLAGYSVLRFVVELYRGDYPANQHYLGGWATPAQVASLFIFAAGLALLVLRKRVRFRTH